MSWRRLAAFLAKAAFTVAVFYVLFTHPITVDGTRLSVWRALAERAQTVAWERAWIYLLLAAGIKAVGIACAMLRWHLLLLAQNLRFPFKHTATTFLIGRFVGTFLPGTVGLDGYKLYDAARFSGRTAEPVAATAVEKLLGLTGILLTYLLAAPLGYAVLGSAAALTLGITVPLGILGVGGVLWLFAQPQRLVRGLRGLFGLAPQRIHRALERFAAATGAYAGQTRLLAVACVLSFGVHFTTAALYYFTALAVGASRARFGEVVFASSIQIFATVVSPLTLAGEGVREAVQALLLAQRIGAPESILSAALGFWAAEALTLVGGFFWWQRGGGYRPTLQ